MTTKWIIIAAVCAVLMLISVITYILYWNDKHKARKKGELTEKGDAKSLAKADKIRRTPEAVLLGWGFFGGAIGAILAMEICRHKTKLEHWYFRAVNILGLIWQVALVVVMVIYL